MLAFLAWVDRISVAALKRSNAEVWAWDDDPSIRKSAMERGINVVDFIIRI